MNICNSLLIRFFIILLSIGFILGSEYGLCLEAHEVLVVANSRVNGSTDLANHYINVREIPLSNYLEVSLTDQELMSRVEYDQSLRPKVLERINELHSKNRIAAIVLIRGMPLKIAPPLNMTNPHGRKEVEASPLPRKTQDNNETGKISGGLEILGGEIKKALNTNMRAAVDSEIALVKAGKYELDGWIENPYFLGFQKRNSQLTKDQVLLVSRLDGPDIKTVYRIINDTLEAEKNGLHGEGYFDARWPIESDKKRSGYTIYDESIHRAAELVKSRMDITLDQEEKLFGEGSCPSTALYCGWYSYAQYIDSFVWQKGSVGYHIASAECSTLRKTKRPLWCLKMLEKGVVATIGPVYEPYVQGFPLPELFFGHLVEGYLSLGESYLISLPYLSWQTILIGDPLYQPFKPLPKVE